MVVLRQPDKYYMQTMKKTILQGLTVIALFFAIWFLLQQVNWMNVFKVERITEKTEQKLGDLFWEIFKKTEKEVANQFVVGVIDSLLTTICVGNDIDRSQIKIHILNRKEVNAFALPNKRIVIYSGLILAAENQEELSGVISHELAHIELQHVMKKLVKEFGLSVLISMTTGGSADAIREAARLLSSTAFDRGLEREADLKAVDYLVNAKIAPEPFANFLNNLSVSENELLKYLSWISTHPESKERARYIIEYAESLYMPNRAEQVISTATWEKLKELLK